MTDLKDIRVKMIDINRLKQEITISAVESTNGKKHFGENFTNIKLIEEKFDKLPNQIFSNPNLKWLDPCAGIANYPIVLIDKLMNGLSTVILDEKHRLKHILTNMLYMVEIQDTSCIKIKNSLGKEINLFEGSFLDKNFEQEYNFKFDVIFGNPPYEKMIDGKRSSKNDNLWTKFIDKAMNLLNDDGYLLFITPQAWMSPTSKQLKNVFLKYKLLYLNVQDCAKYFNVGSKFSYYLIQKTLNDNKTYTKFNCFYPGSTIIHTSSEEGELIIDQNVKFIPQIINKEIFSLLNKTSFNNKIAKFVVQYDSDLHKFTKKDLLSNIKDDNFKYEILHTPSQTVWANRPHKNQGKIKVFIPLTTYYEQIIIGTHGNTQGVGYIICNNNEQAEKIKKILLTDLYRFIANITRWSNFNVPEVMKSLPTIELDKYAIDEINNNLIYQIFSINKNEQKVINKLLKKAKTK